MSIKEFKSLFQSIKLYIWKFESVWFSNYILQNYKIDTNCYVYMPLNHNLLVREYEIQRGNMK